MIALAITFFILLGLFFMVDSLSEDWIISDKESKNRLNK